MRSENIHTYTSGGRAAFFADRMRQDATLRKPQVIGEAVKRLSADTKSKQPQIPWKQIAGMRDKVIHDYFGINLDIIWGVVEKNLPALGRAVQELLDNA
jgi:uncharacterized protein with HEPN domain